MYMKIKRKSLSLIKLYKLASKYTVEHPKVDMAVLADFLKYNAEQKKTKQKQEELPCGQ